MKNKKEIANLEKTFLSDLLNIFLFFLYSPIETNNAAIDIISLAPKKPKRVLISATRKLVDNRYIYINNINFLSRIKAKTHRIKNENSAKVYAE